MYALQDESKSEAAGERVLTSCRCIVENDSHSRWTTSYLRNPFQILAQGRSERLYLGPLCGWKNREQIHRQESCPIAAPVSNKWRREWGHGTNQTVSYWSKGQDLDAPVPWLLGESAFNYPPSIVIKATEIGKSTNAEEKPCPRHRRCRF